MAYDGNEVNNALNEISLDLIRAINKLDDIREIAQAGGDAATVGAIESVYAQLLEATGDLDEHLGV